MLNLTVAMLKAVLTVLLLFQFQEFPVAISKPEAGETLRGQVEILGQMDVPDFASAELAFSYAASSPADAWFIIQTFSQPPADLLLAVWDTTRLTDGDYDLRLRVFSVDGSFQDVFVADVRIRNYTPDPTATPTITPTVTATLPSFSLFNATPISPSQGDSTPVVAVFPTATPLPANPATLTASEVLAIFWKSALAIIGVFILISLLLRLRRNA